MVVAYVLVRNARGNSSSSNNIIRKRKSATAVYLIQQQQQQQQRRCHRQLEMTITATRPRPRPAAPTPTATLAPTPTLTPTSTTTPTTITLTLHYQDEVVDDPHHIIPGRPLVPDQLQPLRFRPLCHFLYPAANAQSAAGAERAEHRLLQLCCASFLYYHGGDMR